MGKTEPKIQLSCLLKAFVWMNTVLDFLSHAQI